MPRHPRTPRRRPAPGSRSASCCGSPAWSACSPSRCCRCRAALTDRPLRVPAVADRDDRARAERRHARRSRSRSARASRRASVCARRPSRRWSRGVRWLRALLPELAPGIVGGLLCAGVLRLFAQRRAGRDRRGRGERLRSVAAGARAVRRRHRGAAAALGCDDPAALAPDALPARGARAGRARSRWRSRSCSSALLFGLGHLPTVVAFGGELTRAVRAARDRRQRCCSASSWACCSGATGSRRRCSRTRSRTCSCSRT